MEDAGEFRRPALLNDIGGDVGVSRIDAAVAGVSDTQ